MAEVTETDIVYVFGDQTDDCRGSLRFLLRTRQDPLLEEFLILAFRRLRGEIFKCQTSRQAKLFNFASLQELLDVKFEGHCKVAVEHAITSICQFAMFMKQCHDTPGCLYPDARNTSLVGICTGSLTAATLSCCRSAAELVPVAVEVTMLSFFVGELAAQTGTLFNRDGGDTSRLSESWAVAIPSSELSQVEHYLEEQKKNNAGTISLPYVGVISPKNVTVCGPPHLLSEMITSHDLKNRPCAPLPIYALYHAEHLYDMNVIEALLHPIRQREMWKLTESIRIITQNSSSCERSRRPDDLSPRGNLGEALSRALKSILLEQMNIGALVAALGSRLGNGDNTRIHVVPICSGAGSQVQSALESFRCGLHVTLARPNLSSCSSFTLEERQKCKIAVVGSSGRFPGGADTEDAFWELLLEGKDVCRAVPASRWDAFTHVDKSERPRKNTSGTSYGCWLDDAGLFDAKFFGMSPREAEQVDPAQRLALMSTYEALEDGGIVSGQRHSHPSRVGVCFGVTSNDWMETNSAQNIDTYMIPGGNRAFIPGRINYAFKFRGPSYAVDTACSSSLAAIGIACNALWMNEADTMIAGGTNIITNPDFTAGLDRGHFLSRTGNCKTFDDSADGYCRGEGVGVVILKRLDEAVHDGDRIKGVIVDIQTNHSAEAESITRPHAKAQSDLFAKVLGGMSPENISYVEMHGTGTQVGDASEMSSVLSAIAPDRSSQRHSREKPVYVGSVKANVGHGEAVAGVTSLIKLLMMLRHKIIPPHIGIKTRLNQRFPQDMSKRGIRIASEATPWECPENEARYALLNNFSAAGGNTTLILEDPPLVTPGTQVSGLPSTFPITISAKTSSALLANISSLLHLIQEQPSLNLPSLSYTTTARRIHHLYRLGWSVKSISDLESKMTAALLVASTRLPSTPPRKAVFVFTGQGGHYIGMGSGLYRQNSSFKAIVDQFDRLAKLLGFASFLPIIKGGDEENFSRYGAEETQMAHTSLQLALLRIWATMGVKPSAVIGHSLGHYAALNAAGVLSDADTLFAVGTRARILQAHCKPGTHCMLSIHAKRAVVESYITEANSIDVSCINSPQDVVVSGERQHIEDLHKTLEGQQIQNTPLDTQFAFHSSQVDPALNHFKTAIRGITFHRAHIPILYPGAENITKTPLGPEHLVRHMREVVDFSSAMQDAAANGVINDRTSILEIGHNATATSLVRRILGNSAMVKPSLERKKSNCATLTDAATWLYEAGVTIDWEEWHRLYARSLQVLRLPHYNWDLKKYWIPYVNDWSLRKGDPVSGNSRQPSLLSPTIHEVVSDDMDNFPKIVEVRTNLNITHLKAIAYGHKVNGLPLCTPSVYADIALTVGLYVQRKFPEALRKKQISIANMFIMKALVAVPKESQWLQTRVFMDKDYATTCTFSTLNNSGQVITQHAKCEIQYNVAMEHEEMTKHTTETMNAIKAMRNPPIDGTAYRFNTNMIYRMVATLAEFDPAYRGLEEIVLDSENMAATGIVKFCRLPAADYQQKCSAPPTYIDCFTQLAGFVMNANDSSDLEKECFVNHGWGSMTLFTDLTENGVYQCHVRMQKREDVVWKGTLVVVQGEQLVAIFKDIELQGVPPRLLRHVLSSAQNAQSRGSEAQSSPSWEGSAMTRRDVLVPSAQAEHNRQDSGSEAGLNKLMDIISEESGIEKRELSDDVELGDLGIDSLLSLLIASRLKDDLGFNLGSGITLFDEFKTLSSLKSAYLKSKGLSPAQSLASPKDGRSLGPLARPSESEFTSGKDQTRCLARPVTSLLLQEASALDSTMLFLFPDGSGSAASYVSLPLLSPKVTVVALISPYRHEAETMTCTLDSLLLSYIAEIKRRQPTGSYALGGWSSGGVFAYCAAQMLLDEGNSVSHILLLDSPPLKLGGGLGQLPDRFYDHCRKSGVFGQLGNTTKANKSGTESTDGLIAHFKATVNLLARFHAKPLTVPQGLANPRVSLCWAGKSALDGTRYGTFERESGDSTDVGFLVEARQDFGAGSWAELFPEIKINVVTLHDWDHFNMMVGDGAKSLGDFITECISCS